MSSLVEDELALPRDLEPVHRAFVLDADLVRAAEQRLAGDDPRGPVEGARSNFVSAFGGGRPAEGGMVEGSVAVHDTVPFHCPGSRVLARGRLRKSAIEFLTLIISFNRECNTGVKRSTFLTDRRH